MRIWSTRCCQIEVKILIWMPKTLMDISIFGYIGKWDIFDDFQTLWASNASFSRGWQTHICQVDFYEVCINIWQAILQEQTFTVLVLLTEFFLSIFLTTLELSYLTREEMFKVFKWRTDSWTIATFNYSSRRRRLRKYLSNACLHKLWKTDSKFRTSRVT